jgi:hypothetical protein
VPLREERYTDWWLRVHKVVSKPRCKAFDSFIILVAWSLWLQRYDMVFNRFSMSEAIVVSSIFTNLELLVCAKLVARLHSQGD